MLAGEISPAGIAWSFTRVATPDDRNRLRQHHLCNAGPVASKD